MEISKNKVSILSSLSSKKMRSKHGLFMAEGSKCALDMLGAYQPECLVATHDWLNKNICPPDIPRKNVFSADKETMHKISSLSTPSEMLIVFRLPYEMEFGSLDPNKLYLMLDGIQDPGNLGTIIRTADWFGFTEVICSKNTVDVFNPKVIQATMGSLRRIKVYYNDLEEILRKNKIGHIYGLLLEGENIFMKKLNESGVIIMGNEGNGLSKGIRSLVTDPLLIPPVNPVDHPDSLNVSVATAITLALFKH